MEYKLTRYEQEVVVNFNAEENEASLYSANPAWIRKMDKLVEEYPETFRMYRQEKLYGKVISKSYKFPKDLITIRSKKREYNLTDEQKKERAERLNGKKINSVKS